MTRVSRKEWMSSVIHMLGLMSNGEKIDSNYAKQLLQDNNELERLAQRKRESSRKVKAINAIRNKSKVLVDKEGNERLRAILSEAVSIMNNE